MIVSAFIAGIYGLFFGSFLNVIDFRFGKWREIVTTRSRCPHCKHTLRARDLVPVLSFIALQGRCRDCRQPISWQYPIVELVTAILTGVVWYVESPHHLLSVISTLALLGFVYSLLVIALQDIHAMTVSDELFVSAFVFGFAYAILHHISLPNALFGVVGSSAILFFLVIVSKEQWMGWGDVFIAVPVGLVLGFPLSLLWLYASFVIGAVYGLGLMGLGKKKRHDPVPFVPILGVSFVLVYLWGNMLLDLYLSHF